MAEEHPQVAVSARVRQYADQVAQLPEIERNDEIYRRAIELGYGPSRRQDRAQVVLNCLYYALLMLALGWVFSMSIDRDLPVRQIAREVVNPDGQVRVGERLLVRSVRDRVRACELTRRWWIVDGSGRRLDFEAERFDSYGPLGRSEEIVGPIVPLDAAPGRGRFFSSLAWDCNLLQRALSWSITTVVSPVEFEILPRAERR